MASRVVDGPDKDWLSRKEMCKLLGVSLRRFDEMVAGGDFLRGLKVKDGSPDRWSWDDVAFWKWYIEKQHRIAKKDDAEVAQSSAKSGKVRQSDTRPPKED